MTKPLLFPAAISYAEEGCWTLGWLIGDGVCLHGQGRCPGAVDQIAMEITHMILDTRWGGIAAARFGAGLRQLSPNHGFLRAGTLPRYTEDYLGLQFDPLVEIAFNNRNANPNQVRVPVEFQLQPYPAPLGPMPPFRIERLPYPWPG